MDKDSLPITNNAPEPTVFNKKIITHQNKLNTKTKDTSFAYAEGTLDSIKNSKTVNKAVAPKKDSLQPSYLNVYYNDELVINFESNFRIYENSDRIQIPFPMSTYGHAIAKEMDTKNLLLTIASFHNTNESIEIGKNRAQNIAERLTKLGIPDSLITLKTQKAPFIFKNGKFKGGITFKFQPSETTVDLKHIDYTSVDIPEIKKIEFNNTTIVSPKVSYTPEINTLEKKVLKNTYPIASPQKPATKKNSLKNSYTVTQLDFKNNKFKGSRNLKNFLATNATATTIKLIGYSNQNESIVDNYQLGLELASNVKSYISKKELTKADMTITALKSQEKGNQLNQGVTLIIE
ncbi:hypothetical protein [Aquimarina agarivorans]|uniref:hypothetical protein n=1 Tax=Aquimarina agarivorans TaxID=980584 RepID=UPI000248F5FE|nr:hypothetical protein [Aquimarina agarivorans]